MAVGTEGTIAKTCYQAKTGDGEWMLIPACWGSIKTPPRCTCGVAGSELERAQAARREAEIYIERLREREGEREARLNQMFGRNRKLHAEVERLSSLLALPAPHS